MKRKMLISVVLVVLSASSFAQYYSNSNYLHYNTRYDYRDAFNNAYKSSENLWKDNDNDGYLNYFDRHDKNPNVGYFETPTYNEPSYYNNYKSSYYNVNLDKTIYEGPKGGLYYINSNGNKTYIKKSNSYGW